MVVNKTGSFITEEPKRKMINNEQKLQDELDKLRIELRNNMSQQKFLENQLFEEEKMKAFLNQQLREKDERVATLIQNLKWEKNDQKMAMNSKEIINEIQEQLKERVTNMMTQ